MVKTIRVKRTLWLGAAALGCLMAAAPAAAYDHSPQHFDLAPQDLGAALRAVGRQTGREIMFPSDIVQGMRSPVLNGDYSADEAVRALISGTGLSADFRDDVVLIRGRARASSADTSSTNEIIVTGSRISGVSSASPTLSISQAEIIASGQHSLGDVVRNIPQNFSGGQNPGVAFNVPTSSGENTGSGTSLNLRGLGQDATLTLLNGHRVVYGGYRQNVDMSAIPLGAIDRVEIVADGASALYGSDAVAGVANVILKPDYDGLDSRVRFGAATDGGDEQQQYSIVGGRVWSGGGFIAAYDFERDTAIEARQRSYAAVANQGLTLYPALKRHSLLVSGHQALGPRLIFKVDASYDSRHDLRRYSINFASDSPFYVVPGSNTVLSLAPSLTLDLGSGWSLSLNGTYGRDHSHYGNDYHAGGVGTPSLRACYCNEAWSGEFGGQGDLFRLPAGDVKVAFGGGYRKNLFHRFATLGSPPEVEARQSNRYAFGELNLPVVSPGQNIPLIHRLSLSAALRYEDYKDVDRLATPKLGLIYAPTPDLDLKASWGKSFKAPTLYQRFNVKQVQLVTAKSRGGGGYPANATVIFLTGGQPDLTSERATTWSATLAVHPRSIQGLRVEASYFDIRYRDRAIAPIAIQGQALSNPAYGDLVSLAPSTAALATATAGGIFYNFSGGSYDPANVVAIIDNRNRNVAVQHARGVDASVSYRSALGSGKISFDLDGSYLDSRQRVNRALPSTQLAGTYFNPPHYRGRGGAVWEDERVTLSAFANYIGGETDTRLVPSTHVGSMTTVDLAASLRLAASGVLRNIDIGLAVQNAFNARPAYTKSSFIYEPTYDSTNYSPVGRFVSLTVGKKW